MADAVLDEADQRLIAALQRDGRLTAERAAALLHLPTRAVQRRLASLFSEAGVRVIAVPPRPALGGPGTRGVMILRIRVLRGKMSAVASALAARDDIPFIDLSAGGDELSAILVGEPESLVFRQLPATTAVTSIEAETVIHVFSDASQWRLRPGPGLAPIPDAQPRDVPPLDEQGQLLTQVIVDPKRLGLSVDANLRLRVPPGRLDEAGRRMAAHPAVHGALATTGKSNLNVAVWLRDLEHLYEFITRDVAALGADSVESVLVGQAIKRPGRSG
jgi:DNA-binding Lrp family transcriptional regulator